MKKINTQRILLTTLVAVAFFGFLLWSIQQSLSEEESLYISPTISYVNPLANSSITVIAPSLHDRIKSPLALSGRADLTGNKLKARIKDVKGLILAESFIQTKDAKKMSDFSLSLKYKKPSAGTGIVEVFLVSAKDGKEIKKISVPVNFTD